MYMYKLFVCFANEANTQFQLFEILTQLCKLIQIELEIVKL